MKKFISVFLSLVLLLSSVVTVAADEPSDWAKEEVEAAISADLIPEYLQKDYKAPVTRGAVAEMFMLLLEKASGKTADQIMEENGSVIDEDAFTDTDDRNVFNANALGIINGTGQRNFSPDGTLKRAQIAAIINRVARVMGYETEGYEHGFTDITDNYAWAYDELGWPVAYGIIKGVGGNRFSPGADLLSARRPKSLCGYLTPTSRTKRLRLHFAAVRAAAWRSAEWPNQGCVGEQYMEYPPFSRKPRAVVW